MKQCFREKRFNEKSVVLIKKCDEIIEDYQSQGLRLTLRQLYYQLVSRNIVPNTEKSYKNVGGLVSDARLAGLLDWDAIEDRARRPRIPPEWTGLRDLTEGALDSYRLDRWEGQDNYVEVWVEKDALAGVLAPLAYEYHVTLMVNRGYSSQSAMYEAANRFQENQQKIGDVPAVLLYLGDHDPSGEDMVRDVEDRLVMFGVQDLTVDKVALTMAQIKHFKPPPNPAKLSDSRAKGYIQKFGTTNSWELDALNPDALQRIVRKAIEGHTDLIKMDGIKKQEEADKRKLRREVIWP
jgi:hypothetical protein